jgi:hypothetical protein
VNVVASVVDRDPADPLVLQAAFGQAGPVHYLCSDPLPRAVAELGVTGCGSEHAVPHRLVRDLAAGQLQRHLEEPGEPVYTTALGACAGRLERRGVSAPGSG